MSRQSSIVELENLLTNQEALAMYMAKASISKYNEALFIERRHYNHKNQKEIIQKEMIRKKRISMMENNENQRTHMKEEVGHEII